MRVVCSRRDWPQGLAAGAGQVDFLTPVSDEGGDHQTALRVFEALESSAGKPFCIFADLNTPHLLYAAPHS